MWEAFHGRATAYAGALEAGDDPRPWGRRWRAMSGAAPRRAPARHGSPLSCGRRTPISPASASSPAGFAFLPAARGAPWHGRTPELSRPARGGPYRPGRARGRGARPTPAECAALAARMDIPAVELSSAVPPAPPPAGGMVLAEGDLQAPGGAGLRADARLIRDRDRGAVPAALRARRPRNPTTTIPKPTTKSPTPGAAIDLGEAAAEQLALALDPYPRKPDATLPAEVEASSEPAVRRAGAPATAPLG